MANERDRMSDQPQSGSDDMTGGGIDRERPGTRPDSEAGEERSRDESSAERMRGMGDDGEEEFDDTDDLDDEEDEEEEGNV
jgi:hypothetical protein